MAKVAITREGTRLVDVTDLMQADLVKKTLKFAATEFRGYPGPKVREKKEERSQSSAPAPARTKEE